MDCDGRTQKAIPSVESGERMLSTFSKQLGSSWKGVSGVRCWNDYTKGPFVLVEPPCISFLSQLLILALALC